MSDRCDFTQWLTQQGLRVTPVRLAMLEILADAPRALRAQEIIEAIRTRRRVNKVTVYRILDDFSRRGIVRRLFVDARMCHYELACEHHLATLTFTANHATKSNAWNRCRWPASGPNSRGLWGIRPITSISGWEDSVINAGREREFSQSWPREVLADDPQLDLKSTII